jgi:hypothetical protein
MLPLFDELFCNLEVDDTLYFDRLEERVWSLSVTWAECLSDCYF